jgi:uncharacterized Zn-finger protein
MQFHLLENNVMSEVKEIIASTEKFYEITKKDTPLCCPMPNMRLWDSHPRVYLPITETGREVCPYCGAVYILKDFVPDKAQ